MHQDTMTLAERLFPYGPGRCYDVGSYNECGTFKQLLEKRGWTYLGLDIREGPNVDIVVPENNPWDLDQVDLIVSGNTLEHVRRPWELILQIASHLTARGVVVLIAPWKWEIHRYPIDCWRILPDGMQALFESAGLRTVEVGVLNNDCFGVATKDTHERR